MPASADYAPNYGVKGMRWVDSGCAAGPVPAACALCTCVSARPPRTTQVDPQAVVAANKLAT